jgi:DNA invertase Pin-like site-specific DNA recombinase
VDGLKLDWVFIGKASGKDIQRPELEKLIAYVRAGDTIVVHTMDRLGRNLDNLRHLVHEFTNRGIKIQFIKEGLTFTGENSPMSTLLLSEMSAFAEFERALIRERQRGGITLAKKRGAFKGRKKVLNSIQINKIMERIAACEMNSKIARDFRISRETLYKYLKENS